MMNQTHRAVLQMLLTMATDDRHADVVLLADAIGQSCIHTSRLLDDLDRAGLVNADTVRLTMHGLVVAAASSRASRGRSPNHVSSPSRASKRTASKAPARVRRRSTSRAA